MTVTNVSKLNYDDQLDVPGQDKVKGEVQLDKNEVTASCSGSVCTLNLQLI